MSELSDREVAGLIGARLDAYGVQSGESDATAPDAVRAVLRAIERTWDLVIPVRLLDEVRDRAELVDACVARVQRHLRLRARRKALPAAAELQVRVEPPEGRGARAITRGGTLTAYDAEELLDAARRWGPGTRIDVVVRDERDGAMAEALAQRASALGDDTIRVRVRRAAWR